MTTRHMHCAYECQDILDNSFCNRVALARLHGLIAHTIEWICYQKPKDALKSLNIIVKIKAREPHSNLQI